VTYPPALQAVVDELGRFPGVGPKSAQRIAFWLMRQPAEDVDRLAVSLEQMKTKLSFCERCCNIAESGGLCPICSDERRDQTVICVVESPPDVVAVERSGPIKEVILCFNSNVEGDHTAMYLSRLLQVPGLVVSQPASGLPVGGDLEFADDLTLGRALDGRRVLND
jgi:recombination protein RecR